MDKGFGKRILKASTIAWLFNVCIAKNSLKIIFLKHSQQEGSHYIWIGKTALNWDGVQNKNPQIGKSVKQKYMYLFLTNN